MPSKPLLAGRGLGWTLAILCMWGCGTVTVSVHRGPLAEPDAEWQVRTIHDASPLLWPFNAHFNSLSGAVGEHLVGETRAPFAGGSVSATVPRRRGLYRLSSLMLGPRASWPMIGISRARSPTAPASSLAIARAELARDGEVLAVKGLASVVEDVDLEDHPGVRTVRFELDNRPVAGWVLAWRGREPGWAWDGSGWVTSSGARHTGGMLQCRPGEPLTLPLGAQGGAPLAWTLMHVPGRELAVRGPVRREDWSAWLARTPGTTLATGTGDAPLTCPASMRSTDALVVLTDGAHPDYLFIDAVRLSPTPR